MKGKKEKKKKEKKKVKERRKRGKRMGRKKKVPAGSTVEKCSCHLHSLTNTPANCADNRI